jgi:hypothetical protein
MIVKSCKRNRASSMRPVSGSFLIQGMMIDQEPNKPGRISSNRKAGAPSRAQEASQVAEEDNAEIVAQLRRDAMERRTASYTKGELLDSAALCKRLGITRRSLSNAVRKQFIFGLEGAGGATWYPSFFVTSSVSQRKLAQVSVALGDLPGDAKWHFFITPKYSLDGCTPLAALDRGEVSRVLSAAVGYKERGLGR